MNTELKEAVSEPVEVSGQKAHTPGPWTVGIRGQFGTANACCVYAGTLSIANVYGIAINRSLEEEFDADGLPNARLIASSPDLLAACKFLMQCIDNETLVRNTDGDAKSGWPIKMLRFTQGLVAAQEAIKSAEGKQ